MSKLESFKTLDQVLRVHHEDRPKKIALRAAYQRAVDLDTLFGSPEHNLMVMETRATGAPTFRETNLS